MRSRLMDEVLEAFLRASSQVSAWLRRATITSPTRPSSSASRIFLAHCPQIIAARCCRWPWRSLEQDGALGMEDVDDLDGLREVLAGEVPYPRRAMAEDRLRRLGRVELRRSASRMMRWAKRSGSMGGCRWSGNGRNGIVARSAAPGTAQGAPLLVVGFRRPHDGGPGIAGQGAAVAAACPTTAVDLGLARRHAGAVEAKIESPSIRTAQGSMMRHSSLAISRSSASAWRLHRHRLDELELPASSRNRPAGALEAALGGGDADHEQRRRLQEAHLPCRSRGHHGLKPS